MKINEFVKVMKNVKMQSEQLAEKLKKMLDVKEYIGISEKKNLIERIINDSIYYEDRIYKIDGIEKYIHTIMYTIETYTNLELSDNLETDYDMLCRTNLLGKVMSLFDGEYQAITALLQMKCNYVLENNNISAKFGKLFDTVLDKLGELADALFNKINDIDLSQFKLPDNLDDIQSLLSILK